VETRGRDRQANGGDGNERKNSAGTIHHRWGKE
jgi:hypothetical protein